MNKDINKTTNFGINKNYIPIENTMGINKVGMKNKFSDLITIYVVFIKHEFHYSIYFVYQAPMCIRLVYMFSLA